MDLERDDSTVCCGTGFDVDFAADFRAGFDVVQPIVAIELLAERLDTLLCFGLACGLGHERSLLDKRRFGDGAKW